MWGWLCKMSATHQLSCSVHIRTGIAADGLENVSVTLVQSCASDFRSAALSTRSRPHIGDISLSGSFAVHQCSAVPEGTRGTRTRGHFCECLSPKETSEKLPWYSCARSFSIIRRCVFIFYHIKYWNNGACLQILYRTWVPIKISGRRTLSLTNSSRTLQKRF